MPTEASPTISLANPASVLAPPQPSRTLWQDAQRRLLRDPLVVVCALYLLLLLAVAMRWTPICATARTLAQHYPQRLRKHQPNRFTEQEKLR